jgi:hypothetical protein
VRVRCLVCFTGDEPEVRGDAARRGGADGAGADRPQTTATVGCRSRPRLRRLRRVQPVSRPPGGELHRGAGLRGEGDRTPEVGVGVATWAIRREWSMAHWRESANLMWWNLEHVTGTYSEHAKTKRCVQRRGATRTVQRGRTARTAPAASVVTRRCDGPAGRGCEQDLWFVPQTAVQATPFTPRRALEQPIRPGAVITLGQATASAGTS